jgi:hypothetical protein
VHPVESSQKNGDQPARASCQRHPNKWAALLMCLFLSRTHCTYCDDCMGNFPTRDSRF